jgi:hypothetical protein
MNDSYNSYNTVTGNDAGIAVAIISGLIFLIFFVLSYAITAFLLGRVFKKAGVPQWAAWVPIYNMWKLLELGDQPGFWAVLGIVPFVGLISIIFMYIAMYNIGRKLGKEGWFVIIAIFLPIVWMIWLGYDDSKWPAAQKKKPARKKSAK